MDKFRLKCSLNDSSSTTAAKSAKGSNGAALVAKRGTAKLEEKEKYVLNGQRLLMYNEFMIKCTLNIMQRLKTLERITMDAFVCLKTLKP